MTGEEPTARDEIGRVGRLVLAVILIVSACAPAVAGVVSASSAPTSATTGDTAPDAGAVHSSLENDTNSSDGDGWRWPWQDTMNSSDEPEVTGPPETEFNASLLRQNGEQRSGRPSVRKFGPGTIWLRHVPTGLLTTDNPNHSRYVRPRTVVTRDHVYLGGFLGWEAPDVEATVHVVTWRPKTVRYTVEEDNRTVTRTKEIAANVTHNRVETTLPGGKFFRKELSLPDHYGETRYVSIWVESPRVEDSRWKTQWAFRKRVNPATQSVPQQSVGARIKWGAFNIGGATALAALVVLGLGKKLLDKIGAVLIHPAELIFATVAPTVPILLLFWNSIVSTLAQRPQLIGMGIGVFVGLVGIWIIRDKPEEWLLLQPTTDTEMSESGAGTWHWANRAHHVIERGRDGRLAVPRSGWIAALARIWPFYDATPLLEFDAHSIEDHKVDSVPEEIEIPDDASVLDKLRTRFTGDGETDEYDEIVPIHPASEHVIDHTGETLTVGFPSLWEWPDEGEGTWVGPVPLPSIRFGLIAVGIAFVVGVSAFTMWLTTSVLWGLMAACLSLVALAVHPNEDSTAKLNLAPASFDAVIANMISTFEGFNDRADATFWRDRALENEAQMRVERADEREDAEMTKLRRLGDRLAPDRTQTGREAREDARDRYGVGEETEAATPKGGSSSGGSD